MAEPEAEELGEVSSVSSVSSAWMTPRSPVAERRGSYWLLVPRDPGRSVDIPDVPMIARFDASDTSWGRFALRSYEPSGRRVPSPVIEHVDADDKTILEGRFPNHDATSPTLLPGQYLPRIWRNGWSHTPNCPRGFEMYPQPLATARRSAAVSTYRLLDHLASAFETVEPCDANADAHGPALRHLLILACTDAEAAWRGVLAGNGYEEAMVANPRLRTTDYVKVLGPMRLNEYAVRMTLHHDGWTSEIAPFATWNAERSTASLAWYDAYNAVKHDRDGSRSRATLRAAVDAVAATVILLAAQFGEHAPDVQRVLSHMSGFEFVRRPRWGASELYFPADEHGFQAVNRWK